MEKKIWVWVERAPPIFQIFQIQKNLLFQMENILAIWMIQNYGIKILFNLLNPYDSCFMTHLPIILFRDCLDRQSELVQIFANLDQNRDHEPNFSTNRTDQVVRSGQSCFCTVISVIAQSPVR